MLHVEEENQYLEDNRNTGLQFLNSHRIIRHFDGGLVHATPISWAFKPIVKSQAQLGFLIIHLK